MFFNLVKDLFKSIVRLRRSGKIQMESEAEKNYCSRWSEFEVLNTLSDLELKILSLYSLTKFFFKIVKELFKSIEGLRRNGNFQTGSKAQKNRSMWSEIQILNTLSDFALKIPSLHSLTKSVFQYSEGLIQINWGPTSDWEHPNSQIGFEAEDTIVLGGLRLKYLTRCQIWRSKYYLYTVWQKCFSI